MLLTHDENSGVLTIAGRLDISVALELRRTLGEYIARHPAPALALAEVVSCDRTVLHLLWSAQNSAARAGKPLRVTNCSAAILETATALALELQELAHERRISKIDPEVDSEATLHTPPAAVASARAGVPAPAASHNRRAELRAKVLRTRRSKESL
jgi:anti-anti-sigma regulatory factor